MSIREDFVKATKELNAIVTASITILAPKLVVRNGVVQNVVLHQLTQYVGGHNMVVSY